MADILEKLRAADFNTVTTAALEGHPFISDAEAGNLSSARLMAFVKEQHSVIRADLLSMRHLAKRCRDSGKKAGEALFTKLAKGEELAMTKLQDFATHLGVTPKKTCYLQLPNGSAGVSVVPGTLRALRFPGRCGCRLRG